MTQQQVAAALRWSQSKVTRVENGEVSVSRTDLLAFLRLFGLSDQRTVDELSSMAEIARRSSHPEMSEVHSKAFREYVEHEQLAQTLRSFEPFYVPGLLQTPEYRRAVLRSYLRFPALTRAEQAAAERRIDQQVQVMKTRQQILAEGGLLTKAHFIVDEAVIRRTVGAEAGDTTVMREQLELLRAALTNPKVDLRMTPFSSGAHPGLGSSSYVLLEFPDTDDKPLFYEENAFGELTTRVDKARIVAASSSFEGMQSVACAGTDLEAALDQAIAAL
ncbi:helix-turn-helix transcriptional regulator [Micromonospora chalcea]|nr:helix-turn-helix transcriptional regulator [Micromonospora chalcea]WDQ00885.1 helix-turn-helix transcriptional regulator [Micromonospora chalcea]